MKIKKYKPKFAVLCRMIDREEDWGLFLLEDDDPKVKVFDTKGAARKAMMLNYKDAVESCGAPWSVRHTVLSDEISLDVPIFDAENDRDSMIRLRWKIVEL